GTAVCEPMVRVLVDLPARSVGGVLPVLAGLDGAVETPELHGRGATIDALLPAARVHELQRRLPALTGGEGALETEFAGYRPVTGTPPVRPRTSPSPLRRAEYLRHVARRGG